MVFRTPPRAFPVLVAFLLEPSQSEWRSYAGDDSGIHYSPVADIDETNVRSLQLAWRWSSPDNAIAREDSSLYPGLYEATPVMADGVLYVSTSLHQVAAIDAASGKTLWVFNPGVYRRGPPALGFIHRGAALWGSGRSRRVLMANGDGELVALDAATGEPIGDFGKEGRVDLKTGLRRPVERRNYNMTSPPMVVGDTVVVGSAVPDVWSFKTGVPGDVRGYDARTGKLLWTFQTVPQDGEFGNDAWLEESWREAGNTNVWTWMTADPELGFVYLPVSTPTNDGYGGHRPGANLFAESIVCLNARTGERVWHFQVAHHGLWDYDLPSAPLLVDIVVDGKPIEALAQITKQGFVFVLDRRSGEPVWPIEERPVPQSSVPGERTSPTQPFPTKPAPFDRQGLSPDDLIDFTPELHAEAVQLLTHYDHGPLYSPPTTRGYIVLPGRIGGGSWAGAAFDPETHVLYVPSITFPHLVRLVPPQDGTSDMRYVEQVFRGQFGPLGLPITKPPYGRITAIDLDTGEHRWMVPLGSGPRDHPAIAHLNLPPLGWSSRGFVLLTKTLLFAVQGPHTYGLRDPAGERAGVRAVTREPMLRAFDKRTGSLLAEIELPANAGGSPMTYRVDGRQFIVVAVGGGGIDAELVALAVGSP